MDDAMRRLAICAFLSGSTAAFLPTPADAQAAISQEAIDGADFDQWQARRDAASAPVIELDARTGDIEAADGAASSPTPVADATAPSATDTEQVPVVGQPDVVVETPEESTDVPDEAGVQAAAEPNEIEQARQDAEQQDAADGQEAPDPFLVRLQVLLDRANASPGVIDGFFGENTRKAISAYETMGELPVDGEPDADLWKLLTADGGKATKLYEIGADDVSGRYVESIPADYAQQAEMDWLGYRDPAEMLAEMFHMDEGLLRALNPDADFATPGTRIIVADPGPEPTEKVVRIVVNKAKGELLAYDDGGEIVLASPATIGSRDNPSPSGTLTVASVAPDPTYSYDPARNFQQGDNAQPLTLPPGPNGPVGNVWIDLSEPTYGIHGTAEPDMIDKGQSHGCVRLTNWDARALAALVVPDETRVEFTQ